MNTDKYRCSSVFICLEKFPAQGCPPRSRSVSPWEKFAWKETLLATSLRRTFRSLTPSGFASPLGGRAARVAGLTKFRSDSAAKRESAYPYGEASYAKHLVESVGSLSTRRTRVRQETPVAWLSGDPTKSAGSTLRSLVDH
jgi:hypothetical protein